MFSLLLILDWKTEIGLTGGCGVKKIASFLLALLIILTVFPASSAAGNAAGKVINVVYDDSGSMVRYGGVYFKNWSQAKYAMEVFAAMLGEGDVMNIYPMSLEGEAVGLTVTGGDSDRVSAVHDMNANYGNTPFTTVKSAAEALFSESGDLEKWLVIITDGAFDDGATPMSKVQSTIEGYAAQGIRVAYLAIGESASVITGNTEAGIYVETAASGDEILENVTSIANQIFEHQILGNKYLSRKSAGVTMSFDIPTDQIIVFAQGGNISIGDLYQGGNKITAAETISVKYSDVLPLNYGDAVTDTGLSGVIAIFDAGDRPFSAGDYSIDISSTSNVQVYYKPGVTIDCLLYYNGTVLNEEDALYAGEYEVELSFIDPLTGSAVTSELLADAELTVLINNNGRTITINERSAVLELDEGEVEIYAEAALPGYVYLTSERYYNVIPSPIILTLGAEGPSSYRMESIGSDAAPIVITAVNAETGALLTLEEWEAAKLEVSSGAGVNWLIIKGGEISTWEVRPDYNGSMEDTEYGDMSLPVKVYYQIGEQYADGRLALSVTIEPYAQGELLISLEAGSYALRDMGDGAEGMVVTVYEKNRDTGEYEPLGSGTWARTALEVTDDGGVGWTVARGSAVSTWILTPSYYNGEILDTASGEVQIGLAASYADGKKTAEGTAVETVSIEALAFLEWLLAFWERYWKAVIMSLIALLLLLSYLPLIKKYMFKSQFRPEVSAPSTRNPSPKSVKINWATAFVPFMKMTGSLDGQSIRPRFTVPVIKIKAAGGGKFYITNMEQLAADNVKLNNRTITKPVSKREAKRRFSPGSTKIVQEHLPPDDDVTLRFKVRKRAGSRRPREKVSLR